MAPYGAQVLADKIELLHTLQFGRIVSNSLLIHFDIFDPPVNAINEKSHDGRRQELR